MREPVMLRHCREGLGEWHSPKTLFIRRHRERQSFGRFLGSDSGDASKCPGEVPVDVPLVVVEDVTMMVPFEASCDAG